MKINMDILGIIVGLLLMHVDYVLSFTVSGEVGPIVSKRGENVTLNCYIEGPDYDGLDHTIKWAKMVNGQEKIISANTIINSRLKNGKYNVYPVRDMTKYYLDLQMKIVDVGLEDNGTYRCLAYDMGGYDILGAYTVDILIKEQVRRLDLFYIKNGSNNTSFDEEIRVEYRNPTDITCQASGGNPPPKLRVFLGHADITEWFIQRRMSVSYTGTQPWNQRFSYSTEITCPACQFSQSDNDKLLQCESTVSGFDNIVTMSKPLIVYFQPQIICPDKYLTAKGARNYVLKCDIVSNPLATSIRWEIGDGTTKTPMILEENEMNLRYNSIVKHIGAYKRRAALAVYKVDDVNFRVKYKVSATNIYGRTSQIITLLQGGVPGHSNLYNPDGYRSSSASSSSCQRLILASLLVILTSQRLLAS